jgi:hypothetical protein
MRIEHRDERPQVVTHPPLKLESSIDPASEPAYRFFIFSSTHRRHIRPDRIDAPDSGR